MSLAVCVGVLDQMSDSLSLHPGTASLTLRAPVGTIQARRGRRRRANRVSVNLASAQCAKRKEKAGAPCPGLRWSGEPPPALCHAFLRVRQLERDRDLRPRADRLRAVRRRLNATLHRFYGSLIQSREAAALCDLHVFRATAFVHQHFQAHCAFLALHDAKSADKSGSTRLTRLQVLRGGARGRCTRRDSVVRRWNRRFCRRRDRFVELNFRRRLIECAGVSNCGLILISGSGCVPSAPE